MVGFFLTKVISLTHLDLCKILVPIWSSLVASKVIPFGRGFYEFEFSLKDMCRVLAVSLWNLSPSLLHTFNWT